MQVIFSMKKLIFKKKDLNMKCIPIKNFYHLKLVLNKQIQSKNKFFAIVKERNDINNYKFISIYTYDNNIYTDYSIDYYANKYIKKINTSNVAIGIINKEFNEFPEYASYLEEVFSFHNFILLPQDFSTEISDYLKLNKNLFKKLSDNILSNINDGNILRIWIAFNNTPHILAWALKNYFNRNISINQCIYISNWFNNYQNLSFKLNKSSITSYNDKESISNLYDEMNSIKINKKINKVFNQFNTEQKNLFKSAKLNLDDVVTISLFDKLKGYKKSNFIKKISSLTNVRQIMELMKIIVSDTFIWNRESVLEYINEDSEINCDVLYDNNNLLLLHIKDYNTIKRIASKTNWCIAKDKRYWEDYISSYNGDRQQLILFNFKVEEGKNESLIGITVDKYSGIVHAHSFFNDELYKDDSSSTFYEKNNKKNIDNILKDLSIPKSVICFNLDDIIFDWNMSSLFVYLFMMHINYDILYNDNNILTILLENEPNILSLFNIYNDDLWEIQSISNGKVIMIFDFNKDVKDTNKISIGKIIDDGNYEYISSIYDSTLKSYLFMTPYEFIQYGHIDDVFIKSNSDINVKLIQYIKHFDNNNIYKIIFSQNYNDLTNETIFALNNYIINLLINQDISFIETIYSNGKQICDIVGRRNFDKLFNKICLLRTMQKNISIIQYICQYEDDSTLYNPVIKLMYFILAYLNRVDKAIIFILCIIKNYSSILDDKLFKNILADIIINYDDIKLIKSLEPYLDKEDINNIFSGIDKTYKLYNYLIPQLKYKAV